MSTGGSNVIPFPGAAVASLFPAPLPGPGLFPGFSTLTPDDRQNAAAFGAALTDDQAMTVEFIGDQSTYGKRQRLVRYGIGGVVGLVAGFAITRWVL